MGEDGEENITPGFVNIVPIGCCCPSHLGFSSGICGTCEGGAGALVTAAEEKSGIITGATDCIGGGAVFC